MDCENALLLAPQLLPPLRLAFSLRGLKCTCFAPIPRPYRNLLSASGRKTFSEP